MAPGVPKTNGYAETHRFDTFSFRSSRDISLSQISRNTHNERTTCVFRDQQEFQAQTQLWRPRLSRPGARRDPPLRSTDMIDEGVEKPLEEMEATRKVLYAKLKIEDI